MLAERERVTFDGTQDAARLDEAATLCQVLEAVDCNLLDEMRAKLDERLAGRQEVLP